MLSILANKKYMESSWTMGVWKTNFHTEEIFGIVNLVVLQKL